MGIIHGEIMTNREPCTIFIKYRNILVPSQFIVVKRVLLNCFVTQDQNEIVRLTGNIPNINLMVQVFDDGITKYIDPYVWSNSAIEDLTDKWTSSNLETDFPILTRGISEFEFPKTWTSSGTDETLFIRNTPNTSRVARADDHRRGTTKSQFILLRA